MNWKTPFWSRREFNGCFRDQYSLPLVPPGASTHRNLFNLWIISHTIQTPRDLVLVMIPSFLDFSLAVRGFRNVSVARLGPIFLPALHPSAETERKQNKKIIGLGR